MDTGAGCAPAWALQKPRPVVAVGGMTLQDWTVWTAFWCCWHPYKDCGVHFANRQKNKQGTRIIKLYLINITKDFKILYSVDSQLKEGKKGQRRCGRRGRGRVGEKGRRLGNRERRENRNVTSVGGGERGAGGSDPPTATSHGSPLEGGETHPSLAMMGAAH